MTEHASDTATIDPIKRAVHAYREAFGEMPTRVAFAPGRANLIGDHTDYCEGFVLPIALSIGCACAVGSAEAASLEVDGPIEPDDLNDQPGWARYAIGTFETASRAMRPASRGARMAIASSVPLGSGLSSSAALEVSVAMALKGLWDASIDGVDLARACQAAENNYAGMPCGLLDQLASVFGATDHAVRIDCRTMDIERAELPNRDVAEFVLIDSDVRHSHTTSAYAERRASCEGAAASLGVRSLRDVDTSDERIGSLPSDQRDAVLHVTSENDRVLRFIDALAAGDLKAAGERMVESHRSLSETYRVSCDEIDVLAELVNASDDVFGARMTGGGFGGWLVALIRPGSGERLMERVAPAYAERVGRNATLRHIVPSDGARLVESWS